MEDPLEANETQQPQIEQLTDSELARIANDLLADLDCISSFNIEEQILKLRTMSESEGDKLGELLFRVKSIRQAARITLSTQSCSQSPPSSETLSRMKLIYLKSNDFIEACESASLETLLGIWRSVHYYSKRFDFIESFCLLKKIDEALTAESSEELSKLAVQIVRMERELVSTLASTTMWMNRYYEYQRQGSPGTESCRNERAFQASELDRIIRRCTDLIDAYDKSDFERKCNDRSYMLKVQECVTKEQLLELIEQYRGQANLPLLSEEAIDELLRPARNRSPLELRKYRQILQRREEQKYGARQLISMAEAALKKFES